MKLKNFKLCAVSFLLTAALCTGSVVYASEETPRETGSHSISENLPEGMKKSPKRIKSRGENALPKTYDPRNSESWITNIKEQDSTGFCWAFSLLDCAAMSSIKSNEQEKDFSLSVWQLAYFHYNRIQDPMGLTSGDSNGTKSKDIVNCGGNALLASMTLAQGISPAEESVASFPSFLRAWNYGRGNIDLPDSYAYRGYRLSESSTLLPTDIQGIKENILKYGAGSLCYSSRAHNNPAYWNKETSALYVGDSGYPTTHAVTVVGWDDNFSKEKFGTQKPEKDGAWLIKNSWGESWGDKGYFWLSYYDKSLTENNDMVQFVHITSMDPQEHLYQYDGTSNFETMNGRYIDKQANVFQAQGSEAVKEVAFYTMDPDVSYTVNVYVTKTFDKNDPTGGKEPSFTATGKTKEQGYHTISLDTPVNLEPNDYFSVVLQTKCANPDISIPIDSTADYGWYYSEADAKQNQSFCMTTYGSWYDLNWREDHKYKWNLRIKALTEDREDEHALPASQEGLPASEASLTAENTGTAAPVLNTKVSAEKPQKDTAGKIVFKKKISSLKVNQKASVKAVIAPAKKAKQTILYASSNPNYAKVNKKGKITAKKAGKGKKVRITAYTKDGSVKKASITLRIR